MKLSLVATALLFSSVSYATQDVMDVEFRITRVVSADKQGRRITVEVVDRNGAPDVAVVSMEEIVQIGPKTYGIRTLSVSAAPATATGE